MKTRWWVLTMLVVSVALPAIGLVCPTLANPIGTAVTSATFVAVLWYAIETRRLVGGQERAVEIARHPWLEATNLKPEPIAPGEGKVFGGFRIWLPITNVGSTPALDLKLETTTTITDPSLDLAREASEARAGQTLVPRDVLHQEIAEAFLGGPQTTIVVKARIAYRTIDQGRGRVEVGFQYTASKGWRNLPTRYETWLADGTHIQ